MYVDGRVRFRVVTCDEEDHRLWRTWRGEKRCMYQTNTFFSGKISEFRNSGLSARLCLSLYLWPWLQIEALKCRY
ncbi:hypothetical protein D0Y65_046739 [Glycine soja]|uniref:Uncharacterized protein n=1 Tax=Glycine soja TaxID=3848 RepID=A0A445GAN6_GLYSO|nr:hypothetical protein D0Y65_046739 [Glycine soja]